MAVATGGPYRGAVLLGGPPEASRANAIWRLDPSDRRGVAPTEVGMLREQVLEGVRVVVPSSEEVRLPLPHDTATNGSVDDVEHHRARTFAKQDVVVLAIAPRQLLIDEVRSRRAAPSGRKRKLRGVQAGNPVVQEHVVRWTLLGPPPGAHCSRVAVVDDHRGLRPGWLSGFCLDRRGPGFASLPGNQDVVIVEEGHELMTCREKCRCSERRRAPGCAR